MVVLIAEKNVGFCAINIGLFKPVIVARIVKSILVRRLVILSPVAHRVQIGKPSRSIHERLALC